MCQPPNPDSAAAATRDGITKPAFSCQRLNESTSDTFVLQEDDRWGEEPLIYAKVYTRHIVLIDSGCGGSANTPDRDMTLRRYLETVPVADYHNTPLNQDGRKAYIIICTHCHYDHVGGLPEFNSVPGVSIWASALGKPYITDPKEFARISLCEYVGMPTPEFSITHWAEDGVRVTASSASAKGEEDLGLIIYQTPGHMSDQVAIFDEKEHVLFVGDTAYRHAPILFPEKGSFSQYRETIKRLKGMVQKWNAHADAMYEQLDNLDMLGSFSHMVPGPVKIASGHVTRNDDAEEVLAEIEAFAVRVANGEIEPVEKRGYGDQKVIEFKDETLGTRFIGLRECFELSSPKTG